MGLFWGRSYFFHRLLRDCTGNWVRTTLRSCLPLLPLKSVFRRRARYNPFTDYKQNSQNLDIFPIGQETIRMICAVTIG